MHRRTGSASGPKFESFIADENKKSASFGGRTVKSPAEHL
jgi:hypothetical protein